MQDETLGTALVRFRADNGLNITEEKGAIWLAQLGDLIVPLPNFAWRRDAIMVHDAHHLITGYSTSVIGEFEVAAWELGVKCYSAWQARFLCRFLMTLGLITSPRRVTQAYKKGHAMRPHYGVAKVRGILDMTLEEAQMAFAT